MDPILNISIPHISASHNHSSSLNVNPSATLSPHSETLDFFPPFLEINAFPYLVCSSFSFTASTLPSLGCSPSSTQLPTLNTCFRLLIQFPMVSTSFRAHLPSLSTDPLPPLSQLASSPTGSICAPPPCSATCSSSSSMATSCSSPPCICPMGVSSC